MQDDVGQAQVGDRTACRVDGARRKIAAHEHGLRQGRRHWQQIGALTAAHFQHPAPRNRRRLKAMKPRDRRYGVWMAKRVGLPFVGNGVVLLD